MDGNPRLTYPTTVGNPRQTRGGAMQLGDITQWGGLGLLGYALFWLLRDNIRLRSEAKAARNVEARAAKAEAQVAGLTQRVADLTEEVARLRKQLEAFIEGEGGGHA